MKIKKICIVALIIVLISSFATSCFAVTESTTTAPTTAPTTSETTKVEITKEKLNEKLQELKEYMNSDNDDDNSKVESIAVNDNIIEITTDKDKYEINYEIQDNKVVFSSETEIKQGMSYEEYKRNTSNIDSVFYGYFAVSNILGIKYEDSFMYYALVKLSSINGTFDTSNSYTIVTPAPGVTIVPDDKTIISTEFGNKAMEYFNSVYKEDKYTYNDSEQYNTFECVTEKKDKVDTSCKLLETLTINTDADFSKISGASDSSFDGGVTKDNADYVYTLKVGQKIKFETTQKYSGYSCVGTGIELSENKNELIATEVGTAKGNITFGNITKSFYITVEENTNNEQLEDITIKIDSEDTKTEDTKTPTTETTSKTETVKNNSDSTTAKTELPKTGINTIVYITMAIVGIAVVSFIILNKKYKDIK